MQQNKGTSPRTTQAAEAMDCQVPKREVSSVESQIRPLSAVRAGETVCLVRIGAGRGLNSRLASMGLVRNTEIRVVSNGHPGPFVIIVKDAKMMLGRGVAHKIIVR